MECRLWVNFGLYRQPRQRSAYRGEADEIDEKADIDAPMSAVGTKADVSCQELSGPLIASSRHDEACEPARLSEVRLGDCQTDTFPCLDHVRLVLGAGTRQIVMNMEPRHLAFDATMPSGCYVLRVIEAS